VAPYTEPQSGRTRSVVAVVAVATLALLPAACGGSTDASDTKGSPTTTTQAPGSAKITKFEVPSTVSCAGKTSVFVSVSYATDDAQSQTLVVDGLEVEGTDAPSATLDVRVHCDALPHTFVVIAKDADGRPTSQQKILTTQL
jgi:hypothetical protein